MADSKKRKWTRGEILQVIRDVEGSLEKAAHIIFKAMAPEERFDQETKSQLDRVNKVAGTVKSRIAAANGRRFSAMAITSLQDLTKAKRIVVKIGSALLVENGELREHWLQITVRCECAPMATFRAWTLPMFSRSTKKRSWRRSTTS